MSNTDDDQPLSSPTVPAAFMRDTSPTLDPGTFKIDRFAEGMRPTRRTIKLHERADLVGVMDEIADRIESAPEDADVDDLIDAFNQARDAFLAGVTYWTVEKRSSEWVMDRWEAYAKANSIRLDKDGDTDDRKERLRLIIDQLVGQIVEVKSDSGDVADLSTVTHERLRVIYDTNEGELNKLVYAMNDANQAIAQSARVLTRDFSLRYSTARSGATS